MNTSQKTRLSRGVSSVLSLASDSFEDILIAAEIDKRRDLVHVDLSDVSFGKLDLRDCSLEGSNLSRADLSEVSGLSRIALRDCILDDCVLPRELIEDTQLTEPRSRATLTLWLLPSTNSIAVADLAEAIEMFELSKSKHGYYICMSPNLVPEFHVLNAMDPGEIEGKTELPGIALLLSCDRRERIIHSAERMLLFAKYLTWKISGLSVSYTPVRTSDAEVDWATVESGFLRAVRTVYEED